MITSHSLTNSKMFPCHKVVNEGKCCSQGRCLESDQWLESLVPFGTKKTRRPDLRLNIEQLSHCYRRDVLLNFCCKIATIKVADRILCFFLTG